MQISSIGQSFVQSDQFEKLFCELYISQKENLYEFVLSKVRSPAAAQDILQDVFLKLWSYHDRRTATIENYKAFIFRITYNETISYLRKEKMKYQVFKKMPEPMDTELNLTEQVIYARQLEILLQQAIQTLSPQRKKIYVLGKIEGIPLGQIAVSLGIATQTVKEMMRLSNQQIRKYINERMETQRKKQCNAASVKRHGFAERKTLKAA